jgi:hypothetical protein
MSREAKALLIWNCSRKRFTIHLRMRIIGLSFHINQLECVNEECVVSYRTGKRNEFSGSMGLHDFFSISVDISDWHSPLSGITPTCFSVLGTGGSCSRR